MRFFSVRSLVSLVRRTTLFSQVSTGNPRSRRRLPVFAAVAALVCLCAAQARAATYTVNVLTDSNPGGGGSGSGTAGDLRYAITEANSNPGSTIQFSVTGNITIAATLPINANMTITGPGANLLTISGANAYTVFTISGGNVAISAVTIVNGNGGATGGGGIYETGGTVAVSDSVFSANTVN